MDRVNDSFLSKPATVDKTLDARLEDATLQAAWQVSTTLSLLEEMRSGLQPRQTAAVVLASVGVSPELDPLDDTRLDELFLAGPGRKKSGERRRRILSGLIEMLDNREEARITTASLARHLDLSEAALYRHFDSKSQILDSLIALIEDTVFEQIGQLHSRLRRQAVHAHLHAATLVTMLLRFAESHPGVSRVMAGDALVLEDESLRLRMSEFFARFEEVLAEVLRGEDSVTPGTQESPEVLAAALSDFCVGRLLGFARSGFRTLPSRELDSCLATMLR